MQSIFYSQFGKTTESFETIPSRDGRIVSIDGRVLAMDVERFDLQVHYRWLEEPPNERWLKQQALTLLKPLERRQKEKVEAAREKSTRATSAVVGRAGAGHAGPATGPVDLW